MANKGLDMLEEAANEAGARFEVKKGGGFVLMSADTFQTNVIIQELFLVRKKDEVPRNLHA